MKTLKVLAGGLVMAFGATALAQGGPPEMHGHDMMPILPGVVLTPQQKAQMHDIVERGHAHAHDDFQQTHVIDRQVSDLLLAPGPVDRAKIDELLHQKDAIESARRTEWLSDALRVHDLLTSQQLTQARSTRAQIESLHAQLHALMQAASEHGPVPEPE